MEMQNLFVEVDGSPVHPKKRAEVIEDYTAFLKKFEHKKTTDDCNTPPAVYNAVLDWVNEHYPLAGKRVLRPFYPGGDYKSVEYAEDCVVIDNPPFSIIAEITKFYIEGNIPFSSSPPISRSFPATSTALLSSAILQLHTKMAQW